jgi:nicotinate-nucleotide pyrophosphorylase (carboxylating)
MHPSYLTPEAIRSFIALALIEDIGEGDHSSLAAVPESKVSSARLLIKDNGIIAGIALAEAIFVQLD